MPISEAALAVITAALDDADLLHETPDDRTTRIATYLLSSGYTIQPDTTDQPAAA